jgi:hypothetical protein
MGVGVFSVALVKSLPVSPGSMIRDLPVSPASMILGEKEKTAHYSTKKKWLRLGKTEHIGIGY